MKDIKEGLSLLSQPTVLGLGALSQLPAAVSGCGVGMGFWKVLPPVAASLAQYQRVLSGEII